MKRLALIIPIHFSQYDFSQYVYCINGVSGRARIACFQVVKELSTKFIGVNGGRERGIRDTRRPSNIVLDRCPVVSLFLSLRDAILWCQYDQKPRQQSVRFQTDRPLY